MVPSPRIERGSLVLQTSAMTTLAQKAIFGAGYENRTRVTTLAMSDSTIELNPHYLFGPFVNKLDVLPDFDKRSCLRLR